MEKMVAQKHCEGDCRHCDEKIFCSENKDFSFITGATLQTSQPVSGEDSPSEKPNGASLPWSSQR